MTTTTTLTAADIARDLNEAATGSLAGGMLVYCCHVDGTYTGGEWLSGDSRPRLGDDERALRVRSSRRRWTAAEVAEEWMTDDEIAAAERARWAEWG